MNMSAHFPSELLLASFFTIKFFYFQVHFLCNWDLFFELNKETSCKIYKVKK